MISYFSNLFSASETEWTTVIGCLQSKVTTDHNEILTAGIEEKEVKAALFSMHPDKSPGPDGMTPRFYQKCWNIVKLDLVEIVKQFFDTGTINDQLK